MGAGRLQFVPLSEYYGLLMIGNNHENDTQEKTEFTARYAFFIVLMKWSKYDFVEVC